MDAMDKIMMNRLEMDRNTAEELISILVNSTDKLVGTVCIVKDNCSSDALDYYQKEMAKIIGSLAWDIMEKIFKQYPDLRPYILDVDGGAES